MTASAQHPAIEPTADRDRSDWDVLALMRFFLAFIVALTHLKVFVPLGALAWIEQLGWFEAVLGFLLISGYSIGHSIQKRPAGYFLRRLWRIYPVYLAAIAITYFVRRDAWTWAFAWHLVVNFLFLGEVVERNSYVVQAWTLNVEVWLYCVAPLLLRLRARGLELVIGLSFACYALYTISRSLFQMPYYSGTIGGINLPCLAFIWIAGFYLSTARDKRRPLAMAALLLLGHYALTVGIQLLHRIKHHQAGLFVAADLPGYAGIALLLVLIVVVFRAVIAHGFHFTTWQSRIARFLGDISYPLYLVHYAVFSYAAAYFSSAVPLLLCALTVATAVYFGCDFYSRRRRSG